MEAARTDRIEVGPRTQYGVPGLRDASRRRAGAVVESKLVPPPRGRNFVRRPRLTECFASVDESRLTLVTGPAGSGKTTAVREWAEEFVDGAAWVTLDTADNEPYGFWQAVSAALQRVAPEAAGYAPQDLTRAALLDAFVTHLHDRLPTRGRLVLILDDFQVIESATVVRGLQALLEHKPGALSVVLVSRSDPQLPLARWRVRNELTEIRDADLRFRPDEVRVYLTSFQDLALDDEAVAVLAEKTEGWIAGLQLVALSIRGSDDPQSLIDRFRGTDRFVADFLLDEVLARQPDDVRDFLLATSVLDRFDAALCEAVTGVAGAQLQLRRLEAANLFLVPLDATRTWFRYHALFAQLLRSELGLRHPEHARALHGRAATRLAGMGQTVEAIGQHIAAGNEEGAFELLGVAGALLFEQGRADACDCLDLFSPAFIGAEPARMLTFADALRTVGRLDDSAVWLQRAGLAGVRHDEREHARVLALWTKWHQARGDASQAIEHGERIAALVPEASWVGERFLEGLPLDLARASLLLGATEQARASVEKFDRGQLDSIGGQLAVPALLARIAASEGRLRDAETAAARALRAAKALKVPNHPAAADALLARARVLRERNDSAGATRDLGTVLAIAGRSDSLPYLVLAQLELTRVIAAEAGRNDARDHFRSIQTSLAEPLAPPLGQAMRLLDAELCVRVGDVERAAVIAGGMPEGFNRQMLEAVIELTSGRRDGARRRLTTVTPIRLIDRIRLELLRAMAADDFIDSRRHVAAAARLAAPEGFRRIFIGTGPAVSKALRSLATSSDLDPIATELVGAVAGLPRLQTPEFLVDPFSEREQSVLRYLPTTLSHHDIATELLISVNTLKTHVRSIYVKLGVSSRAQAVLEARRLGLIGG